jgi:hypothetical protein
MPLFSLKNLALAGIEPGSSVLAVCDDHYELTLGPKNKNFLPTLFFGGGG